MRSNKFLSIAAMCSLLLLGATHSASGQVVSNPVPAAIQPGISVGIELFATLPNTENSFPDGRNTVTRINFYRQTTDGRRFVNDQRGFIYELDSSGNDTEYVNTRNAFTNDIYTGSLASGLTSFAFHPDFANNGLFYTLHTETPNGSPTPDHIPATFNLNDVSFHAVVTEWTASTPSAGTFSGTRREVLRIGSTGSNAIHPLGDLSYNPTAGIGDADYGMLYISGGDWALSGLNRFDALQRTDTLAGTMLRIDPTTPTVSGGIAGLGDYTIPADNPFANDGDPNTLGEIFAYGFRNCHRVSWDSNGNMYGMDIGLNQLEEINIILPGKNYGWGEREGTFLNGQAVDGDASRVWVATDNPLFQEPVAQYDHDEGAAISCGYAYFGTLVPELQGKFVFGDIVDGRLLYCDIAEMLAADDGDLSTVALVQELRLNVGGSIQTLQQITGTGRVDMRLGQDNDGEIYVMSKGDGTLRRLVTLIQGPSEWNLIDDFEGHTAGNPIESVVGPGATWTGGGEGVHTAQADPSDATNLAMQVTSAPGNGVLRAELGSSDFIAAGTTGTLFYRIRTPVAANGTTDHVLGLTDNNSITNFNFKSGLRNTVPAGVNNMDIRDGVSPGYESVGSLADNTWYSVWMVSTNTNPGTFEVYMQSDTDANFATQTKLATVPDDPFDYRINGDTSIVNVYFRNANNTNGVAGNDLYFDDIYINSNAVDLTDPTAPAVLLGDFNGDGVVDCADLDGYVGNIGAAATGALAALDFDGDGVLSQADATSVITTLVVAGGVAGTFPGDVNCDGMVNVLGDAFPLVASLNSAVTTYAQGDLNFSGLVDVLGDAFILVANLGNTNQ